MAKVFDFQWQIPVPDFLLQGACFDRWEEVRSSLCHIAMGVDHGGAQGGQVPPPRIWSGGTLMQIVPPPQILSYRYKNERSVAF